MNAHEKTVKKFRLTPLWEYVSTRYSPTLHGFYSVLWYLYIAGAFAGAQNLLGSWRFGWIDILAMFSLFGIFFFMRTVDEIKDLEYDRICKPDRVLVQGKVTVFEMSMYAAVAAAVLVGVNACIAFPLAAIAALIMCYSVGLLALERLAPGFKKLSLYFTTAVAVQLKTGAVVYVYAVQCIAHGCKAAWGDIFMICSFVLAYLHWETARKIAWPKFAKPHEELYSTALGVPASLFVSLLLLVAPTAVLLSRLRPWEQGAMASIAGIVTLLSVLPSVFGSALLLRQRNKRFPLTIFAMASYVIFMLSLVVQTHRDGAGTWIVAGSFLLFVFEIQPVSKFFKKLLRGRNRNNANVL